MLNNYEYIEEINNDFEERMQFLKKYYPYFKICGNGSSYFNDERLANIDVGLIVFALLRFLVEENNFNNRGVTYREIREYLKQYIAVTYKKYLNEETEKTLVEEVYSMLTNGGQPILFEYYNPIEEKHCTSHLSLIKSEVDPIDGVLKHYLTESGIEFFLETKEIKEFNKISIQQVLLEKMVNSRNFKGARQVVRRISNQVSKLYQMKREILAVIGFNAEEGERLYELFCKSSKDWFEQEEGYFEEDLRLVEEARRKLTVSDNDETRREINQLNDELKQVSAKYGALLNEYVDLQKKVDDIRRARKIKVLMSTFDFNSVVEKSSGLDDANELKILFNPLLEPFRRKFFDFTRIDQLLRMKYVDEDEVEEVAEISLEDYVFEDELANKRIEDNHNVFLRCLFRMFKLKEEFTLRDYNDFLEKYIGRSVFKNGDYYSFLIALSAKNEYDILNNTKDNDMSVLETAISEYSFANDDMVAFKLEFIPEDKVELQSGFTTTNIRFIRK